MWLLRVAALLSPLPYGQNIVAVLGIVMFDQELIVMAEYEFVNPCCMHAGVLVKFCFAVNWSIEHLAMSLIVLSQYSENVFTSELIASSLLFNKSIILV